MGDILVPLAFLGAIGGLVTLGVGLNILTQWAKHRFTGSGDSAERLASMEARVAELEERADFTERALTEAKSRRQLES
jgi:hypothetical protein